MPDPSTYRSKAQRSQCPRKLEHLPCLRKPRQQHHPLLLLQLELPPPAKKAGAKSPPKGKSKGTGKPLTPAETAKTPCIFHQMPSGCIHGAKCQYDHTKAPPPKKSEPDAKSKSKAASVPKVPAAVAIIAALSSLVSPSHSLGTLEWCADTGAGRHLISYEALNGQGFQCDAVKLRERLPRKRQVFNRWW